MDRLRARRAGRRRGARLPVVRRARPARLRRRHREPGGRGGGRRRPDRRRGPGLRRRQLRRSSSSYHHDLDAWDALPVEEQERAIGRTKLSDLELPDDVKPANSHVALTMIEDEDGEEQQIVRVNMPFGRVGAGEFGTYFIGYARTPAVIEQMLTNMFVGDPPGTTDRILDFSTAVTGNLFFVPTVEFLDDPPSPATRRPAADPVPRRHPATGDGSLGIGSLKEDAAMNHLLRELAPISDAGLAGPGRRGPRAARRRRSPPAGSSTSPGPHGWEHSATNLGRTSRSRRRPADGVVRPAAPRPAARRAARADFERLPRASCATPTAAPTTATGARSTTPRTASRSPRTSRSSTAGRARLSGIAERLAARADVARRGRGRVSASRRPARSSGCCRAAWPARTAWRWAATSTGS